MSDSLRPHGLYSPWTSPGQNTGVGSLSLLQGNLPNPGIELRSPALQADSLPAEPQGKTKNTGVGSLSFSSDLPDPGLELALQAILYQLSYQGSPDGTGSEKVISSLDAVLVRAGAAHFTVTMSQYGGFSGITNGEESASQCRRCKRYRFEPWVGKIPWRRKWQPTPVFLPVKSHEQRSLVGYSPWGCKDSDVTD